MPSKITLTVTEGKLKGQQHVFDERATCVMGREKDCSVQLPDDDDHAGISRHHCLLDINPPDARVRDFGSLNGTYVNGVKIGQRQKHHTVADAAQMTFPQYDLKDGDQIMLGRTALRVNVFVPALCGECSTEILEAEKKQAEVLPGTYQCAACRKKAEEERRRQEEEARKAAEAARLDAAKRAKAKHCAKCGKNVAGEEGANRNGDFVCAACKSNPAGILKLLLAMAKGGDPKLLGIRGYTVLRELGRGGMGAVYLARKDETGEVVALKVMLPQVALEDRAKEMFMRETANTMALQHQNIIRLHDSGCSNGTFFLTLEFCDGGSVDNLMKQRGGPLPIDEATGIVLQALEGLEYAHAAEMPHVKLGDGKIGRGRGLVHRDLKPANLFLTGTGSSRMVKIGDYGMSKAFELAGLSGLSMTGNIVGTPAFMPRQQVLECKYAKPDVDVWAMAATLYCLLTFDVPRNFSRHADPWKAILDTDAVPIRRRNPSIPKALAEVIDRALVDRPGIQFKTAAEFRRELQKAL